MGRSVCARSHLGEDSREGRFGEEHLLEAELEEDVAVELADLEFGRVEGRDPLRARELRRVPEARLHVGERVLSPEERKKQES